MIIEVKVPSVGESVTSGIVSAWHKKSGEFVNEGEPLFALETDKVSTDIVAEKSGVLETKVPEGQEVKIGEVVAIIDDSKQRAEEKKAEKQPDKKKAPEGKKKEQEPKEKAAPVASAKAEARFIRKKMSPLRRKIAQQLVMAQHTAAILTTFNECDMSTVQELRRSKQDEFTKKHGIKLGLMSFFVKAAVEALKTVPVVNGRIDGDDFIQNNFYDIGVAVGTERGLVVPVVRDADNKSLADLERDIADFAGRARDGKLKLEDLQGGTFTITNGGVYGSLFATPILNPPQSGILGMHKIMPRPVAVDGKVEVRPMMYLALSYDHRAIDGKEAVTFLIKVKECIEDPKKLPLDF